MSRIETKRKKPKKPLRKMFARTASRRQRAATASANDFESEVPNQSIGQVLLVLLILHVVAIVGIYVHSNFIDVSSTTSAPKSPAALAAVEASGNDEAPSIQEQLNQSTPPIASGDDSQYDMHRCMPNETYATIAAKYQVSETKLREVNAGGRGFTPGDTIRIPKPEPKLITPKVADRRAVPVGPTDSGNTVKVAPGSTLSRIARENGVTIEALMELNGITDPRKLRAGQTLKLPAAQ